MIYLFKHGEQTIKITAQDGLPRQLVLANVINSNFRAYGYEFGKAEAVKLALQFSDVLMLEAGTDGMPVRPKVERKKLTRRERLRAWWGVHAWAFLAGIYSVAVAHFLFDLLPRLVSAFLRGFLS